MNTQTEVMPALSPTEERVIELLGDGHTQHIVAQALGLTPSRVSQIAAEPHIREAIALIRADQLQGVKARDQALDTLEDTVIGKLTHSIHTESDPNKLARILAIVNGAKRRSAGGDTEIAAGNNTLVQINLPAALVTKHTVDARNQVVAVDGVAIATLPSGQLGDKYEEHKQREQRQSQPIEHASGEADGDTTEEQAASSSEPKGYHPRFDI